MYVEVKGGGVLLPLNSMQLFSEHAVPFEQRPPPTTAPHSNVDSRHRGYRNAEA